MARILEDLDLYAHKIKGKDDLWELTQPLYYHVGGKDSEEVITVPVGFISDFASIPWGLRNIFSKDSRYSAAAVIHDFCYQKQLYSQKKCDKIFLEAMQVLGVPLWKRRLMYRSLRMFGWISYRKNKK